MKIRIIGGYVTSKYKHITGLQHKIEGRQSDACYEYDTDSTTLDGGTDSPEDQDSQSNNQGTEDR